MQACRPLALSPVRQALHFGPIDNTFVLFSDIKSFVICHSSNRKLVQAGQGVAGEHMSQAEKEQASPSGCH